MTWIRTDWWFGERTRCFSIADRVAANLGMPRAYNEAEAKVLGDWLEDLIARVRPEWPGAIVVGMSYEMAWRCWLLMVAHESFDCHKVYSKSDAEPLIKETDAIARNAVETEAQTQG